MYRITANINNKTIEEYQEDILFLFEIIDSNLENILQDIGSSVYDYSSANKLKNIYNKNWFCDLLMSVDAKVKIATLLKTLCQPYEITSLTWDSIIDKNTVTLEQIDILQNKDILKKTFEG